MGSGIGLDEEFDVSVAFDPADLAGCPVFSKKLRTEFDDTDVTLDGTYKTLFTYSGSGKLVGFVLSFDGTTPQVRLKVDGDTIYDIEMQDILDAQFDTNGLIGTGGGPVVFGNQLVYRPVCPIAYATTVLIEATDSTGKKLLRNIITLTKET